MPNPVTEGLNGARAVRKAIGLKALQALDPTEVAEQLGVMVVFRPLRSTALSGIHLFVAAIDQSIVMVNSLSPYTRQRFTLAHELGHSQFDKETIVETISFSATNNYSEKRANAFAGELLLPEAAVKEWKPGKPWGEDCDDVAKLANAFGVSFEATLWRISNAGFNIDVEDFRKRTHEISEEYRTILKRPGTGVTHLPNKFTSLVERGLERSLVSRGRARELLETLEDI